MKTRTVKGLLSSAILMLITIAFLNATTWQNDIIYYEMMYVVEKTDIYPPAPEFIWSYQDPFN